MTYRFNSLRKFGLVAALLAAGVVGCQNSEERIAGYLASARELHATGEEEKARLQLRNVLEIDKGNVDANLMLAESYASERDWSRAIGHLKTAATVAPENIEVRIKLVQFLLLSGALEEAESELSSVELFASSNPRVQMLRGLALARRGKAEEASELTAAAVAASPDDSEVVSAHATVLLMRGATEDALGALARGLEHHPDNLTMQMLQFQAHAAKGEREQATAVLHAVLQREPAQLALWRVLAIYQARNGDTAAAEQVLRNMVVANPESVEAKLMLASFLGQSDIDSAIEALKGFVAHSQDADIRLKFALGEAYLRDRSLGDASEVYGDIVRSTGSEAERLSAQNQLARIALKQNKSQDAAAIVQQILAADAHNPDALLARAIIALSERRADDAIFDLRLVLRERPGSDQANLLLARAYMQNSAAELAERSLVEALKTNPLNEQAAIAYAQIRVSRQDYAGALKVLDTLASGGGVSAGADRLRLQILLAQRDWRQVTNVAGRIADRDNRPEFGKYVMALTLQAQEQCAEAIKLFEEVIVDDPELLGAAAAIVQCHAALGSLDKGLDWLRGFVASSPEVVERRLLLANQLLQGGHVKDATAEYTQVIALNPAAVEAYKALAAIALRDNDAAGARARYEQGIAVNPESMELKLLFAGELERSGDTERAMALYRELLLHLPTLDVAANNYAVLLAGDGSDKTKLAEAQRIARRFESSNNPWYADTLGWIYHQLGQFAEAEKLLSRAVEGAPDEALFRYHLGACLMEVKRTQEARTHLERAEALAREHGEFEGIDEMRVLLARLAHADAA